MTSWHPETTPGTVTAASASTSSPHRCGSPWRFLCPAQHPELQKPVSLTGVMQKLRAWVCIAPNKTFTR